MVRFLYLINFLPLWIVCSEVIDMDKANKIIVIDAKKMNLLGFVFLFLFVFLQEG